VSIDAVARIPAAEVYIRQGDVIARDSAEARAVNVLDATRTHRFSLLARKPRVNSPGGTIHVASAKEYPISTTITGVVTRLHAGAMHAPHWHPNANEWHYVARGRAQVTLFAPDKRMAVAELSPATVHTFAGLRSFRSKRRRRRMRNRRSAGQR
jgi:oxalate decarboxylase